MIRRNGIFAGKRAESCGPCSYSRGMRHEYFPEATITVSRVAMSLDMPGHRRLPSEGSDNPVVKRKIQRGGPTEQKKRGRGRPLGGSINSKGGDEDRWLQQYRALCGMAIGLWRIFIRDCPTKRPFSGHGPASIAWSEYAKVPVKRYAEPAVSRDVGWLEFPQVRNRSTP